MKRFDTRLFCLISVLLLTVNCDTNIQLKDWFGNVVQTRIEYYIRIYDKDRGIVANGLTYHMYAKWDYLLFTKDQNDTGIPIMFVNDKPLPSPIEVNEKIKIWSVNSSYPAYHWYAGTSGHYAYLATTEVWYSMVNVNTNSSGWTVQIINNDNGLGYFACSRLYWESPAWVEVSPANRLYLALFPVDPVNPANNSTIHSDEYTVFTPPS